MDGTLIRSSKAIARAFKEVLKKLGITATEEEILQYKGLPLREWMKELLPEGKDTEDFNTDKIVESWKRTYLGAYIDDIKLVEGTRKTLKAFQKDYKLALVTNSPGSITRPILEELDLRKFFDFVLVYEDFEGEGKPSPRSLLMSLEKLGLGKDEVVYIGDNKHDKMAGKRAGIKTYTLGEDIERINDLIEILKG